MPLYSPFVTSGAAAEAVREGGGWEGECGWVRIGGARLGWGPSSTLHLSGSLLTVDIASYTVCTEAARTACRSAGRAPAIRSENDRGRRWRRQCHRRPTARRPAWARFQYVASPAKRACIADRYHQQLTHTGASVLWRRSTAKARARHGSSGPALPSPVVRISMLISQVLAVSDEYKGNLTPNNRPWV